MTILVTGATGLVGARLLPRLLAAGVDCRALVRAGKTLDGVNCVEGDLFDSSTLDRAVAGISGIIHLAAVFRTQDTDLIWKSNLEGTQNLISAVKTHAPDARFIFASTSMVYESGSHPGHEDDSLDPKNPYSASKVAAEQALRTSDLNWAILRFPFVYGDGDGHLEALPKLAIAHKLHPATRLSTIHHRDVATAIQLALNGSLDGKIINITDEAPTSIYELAKLVGEPVESSSEPLETPWRMHVDGTLARSLGFKPSVRTIYQAIEERLL